MNKLIKKYNSMPVQVKASLWFLICSFLQKGIAFITVPIFTRLLSTEEFGLYNVYLSWYTVLSVFATLNLGYGVFYNGLIKYKTKEDEFSSSMLGLSTFVTIALFLIFLCFKGIVVQKTGLPFYIIIAMFIQFIFEPAFAFWAARQRFEYKYKSLVICTLLFSFLTPVIGIVAVLFSKHKDEARIISMVAVHAVLFLVIYLGIIKRGKKLYIKEYWKFALMFNIPLIPHYLSQNLLNQADRIMINHYTGTADAGIYSVAYSIAMIINVVVTAINNSFVPWTYQNLDTKSYEKIDKIAEYALIFIGILVMLVIGFAPEAVRIFAPTEYYNAVWVIPPVTLSVYFIFMYNLFANVEFFYEENKFIMFASIGASILNIVLNMIFIPKYGYIAAGFTTLASYIASAIAHYIFMRRICNVKNISVYKVKNIILITISLTILVFVFNCTYNFAVIRYILIFALLIIVLIKRKSIIMLIKEIK